MTETRTPDEIERDIERERQELAAKVGAIQEKFSPEALIRSVADGFRDHGGEFGAAVSRSVKQNPVALALTGIGLAWMMFGRSTAEPVPVGAYRTRPSSMTTDLDDWADDSREGGRTQLRRDVYSATTRSHAPERTSYPGWSRLDLDEDWDNETWENREDHGGHGRDDDTIGLSERAAASIRSATDSVTSALRDGAARMGEAGSHTAEAATDMSNRARERLYRARARLSRGTEDLSEAARERVIVARARAVEMAQKADRSMRAGFARGRDVTQEFIEEQPLVAGALAVAVGAALAGALPRTHREDEWLGAKRDDMFDEAERIFREEKRKAARVAQTAMSEAADIAEETRDALDASAPGSKSAVEALTDEMKKAGDRVANAALDSARDQKLGQPGS